MISMAKSFTLVAFLCWSSLVTLGVSGLNESNLNISIIIKPNAINCGCENTGSTCPEPTTCPESTCATCASCPVSPEELCAAADAYYCESANICLTTRFAPTTIEKALDKCKSLSDERVEYGAISYDSYDAEIDEEDEPLINCIEIALPASGIMANEKFWDIGKSKLPSSCKAYEYGTKGDEILYPHNLEFVGCYEDHAFSCAGFFIES